MSEYIANKVITIIWPYNSIVVSKSRWKDATADSARKLHKKRPKKRITLKWLKKVVLKKMKIVSNKRVTSRSPTPPPPPQLLSCKTNTFLSSPKNVKIECFHSRGQHLCKLFGTKESVCIRKEFNSHRTGLGHQHDRRFIVLGHQSGRRDVMWKHSIEPYICVIISPIAREEVGRGLVLKMFWISHDLHKMS